MDAHQPFPRPAFSSFFFLASNIVKQAPCHFSCSFHHSPLLPSRSLPPFPNSSLIPPPNPHTSLPEGGSLPPSLPPSLSSHGTSALSLSPCQLSLLHLPPVPVPVPATIAITTAEAASSSGSSSGSKAVWSPDKVQNGACKKLWLHVFACVRCARLHLYVSGTLLACASSVRIHSLQSL